MRRHHVGLVATAAVAGLIWWQVPSLDAALDSALGSSEASTMPAAALESRGCTATGPRAVDVREVIAAAEVTIACLAAESGAPLAETWLRLTASDGAQVSARADAGGVARLSPCPPGTYLLLARRAGRADLVGRVRLAAADNRIALAPGGTVVAQVVDGDGAPAAGVRVRLLPPLLGHATYDAAWSSLPSHDADAPPPQDLAFVDGAWRAPDTEPLDPGLPIAPAYQHGLVSWCSTTGADGMVTWLGVPLGSGFRWGVLPPRHADVSPRHEDLRLRGGAEGVVVGAPPPPGLSGAFAVGADGPARGHAVLVASARVRGRLVEPLAGGTTMRLRRIAEARADDGVGASAIDIEADSAADRDGRFAFQDVRPGTFLVTACWFEPPTAVRFASVAFRLASHDDLDLGAVRALSGVDLPLRVDLCDELGQPVAPEAAFRNPAEVAARVYLATRPEDRLFHHTLFEAIELPLQRDFVLQGLPRGRVRLQTAVPLEAGAAGVIEVRQSVPLDAHTDGLASANLQLTVRRGGRVRLDVRGVDGRDLDVATIQVREVGTGVRHTLPWLRDDPRAELTLPPGRHQLVCTMAGAGADDGGSFGLVECEVRGGTSVDVELRLRPGAGVTGTARDASGRALRQAVLRWTLPAWRGDAAQQWLWSVRTDAEGRFAVRGLPPNCPLAADDHCGLRPLTAGMQSLDVSGR